MYNTHYNLNLQDFILRIIGQIGLDDLNLDLNQAEEKAIDSFPI